MASTTSPSLPCAAVLAEARAAAPAVALAKLDKFKAFAERFLKVDIEPFQELVLLQYFSGIKTILVLIPRGNGKTTLFAALAIYHLITTHRPRITLAASGREQANIAFSMMKDFIQASPALAKRIEIRHNRLFIKKCCPKGRPPGATGPCSGGKVESIASDTGGTKHGGEITLGLIDEIHAHKNDKTYGAVRTSVTKRKEAQIVSISTEGEDETGLVDRLRTAAMQLSDKTEHVDDRLTVARTPNPKDFVMLRWAAREDDDIDNAAVLKKCNPASFVSQEDLRRQIEAVDVPPWQLAAYHANRPMPEGVGVFEPGMWERLARPGLVIPDGDPVWLSIDLGVKRDNAAMAIVGKTEDGLWAVKSQIWVPPGNGEELEISLVEEAVREAGVRWRVNGVIYDPYQFVRSAQLLGDEGFLMIEHPQRNERMAGASQVFYEAVKGELLVHDDDAVANAHIRSAAKVPAGDWGWRLSKRRAKKPMDFAVALCMAINIASSQDTTSAYQDRGLIVF